MHCHMFPENPEGTQLIVGSMNMGRWSVAANYTTTDMIYIRHCQESNSQSIHSQASADSTWPKWRIYCWSSNIGSRLYRYVDETVICFRWKSRNPPKQEANADYDSVEILERFDDEGRLHPACRSYSRSAGPNNPVWIGRVQARTCRRSEWV